MSTQLNRIAKKTRCDPRARFASPAQLLAATFLQETWSQLKRRGASGVDGESTEQSERELDSHARPPPRGARQAHRSRLVKAQDEAERGMIALQYPPAYAPRLNMGERICVPLERHAMADSRAQDAGDVRHRACPQLRSMQPRVIWVTALWRRTELI